MSKSPRGEKSDMPNVRGVYISRSNIYLLAFIIGSSFFVNPNAFVHPALCVIWWAIVLMGLNSIREDNASIPKRSRSQLIDENTKLAKRVRILEFVNEGLWSIIRRRKKKAPREIPPMKNKIIGMRIEQR